ncbi:MAG: alkaline phosphatase [Leucobacter sp.]
MKLGTTPRTLLAGALSITMAGAGIAFAAPALADNGDNGSSPKNVIVLIGDGMGYNHIDFMNAETTGEVHWQVQRGGDKKVIPSGDNTQPTEGWQAWNHLGMSTHWHDGPVYDPYKSWTDFSWNRDNPTDSAAAGTAMATGVKTYNAGIGVDYDRNVVENLSERAKSQGKSAGVVSSVPYSHATPAAYSAHAESRNDYHSIAQQQIDGDLEVVIGAAHPFYTDNHQTRATGNFTYVSQQDWDRVSSGATDRAFLETKEDFEALTTGDTPERVFGTPQVASTLQQARSAGAPLNDVPDLPTLTRGAINMLDNNDEGFFLMVEGGAIDWTGHANQSERNLEEVKDFDAAVGSVVDWVETNSNWDETLVVVTADHETGYLYGATPGDYSSIIPSAADAPEGTLPQYSWNSDNHTNQLVGFFYRGAGAEVVTALGTKTDTVRGRYLANTSMASGLLNDAWAAPAAPAETSVSVSFGTSKVAYNTAATATVKVSTADGADAVPTGKVSMRIDGKTYSSTLNQGTAKIRLTKPVRAGKQTVTASYAGAEGFEKSSAKSVLTVTKAVPKVSAKLAKSKVKTKQNATVKVAVSIPGSLGAKASQAKVQVFDGKKRIKTATTNKAGKVNVKLSKLKAGSHKIRVQLVGDGNLKAQQSASRVLKVVK